MYDELGHREEIGNVPPRARKTGIVPLIGVAGPGQSAQEFARNRMA
jgi:hypothetical protein